jgi:hypothetical protein
MRAVRLEQPLTLDGRLDEEIYTQVPSAGGFIQQEPSAGQPATEPTDVWVFFDDKNVYVSARCWATHPERWVVTELQRDANITDNESVAVHFDTFYDRRNGFAFQTSPNGTLKDQTFTDGVLNLSWNTVWDVRTARFDGGWTMEMVIPFKSLRYPGSGPQVWGIQFRRIVRWKNEVSHLTEVPAAYGLMGAFRAATYGTLVGLEAPARSLNLEVKPYFNTATQTEPAANSGLATNFTQNAGADLKYGISRGLIADVTVNTDFAQVEEDVQQINLTRFSLFFPEKRDFFLEGQGTFAFGGASLDGNAAVASPNGLADDIPILFFSRQIGLNSGLTVPVIAGGRVTGKAGKLSIGALSIGTDSKPSANAVQTTFNVLRLKRDVLRRSNIGMIATHRSRTSDGTTSNAALGLDANLLLFDNVTVIGYLARTYTPGLRDDSSSYRGLFDYGSDRYGVQVEQLKVGENFNPAVGFMKRSDFRRSSGRLRFSPRPRSSLLIRKFTWQLNYDYITDGEGRQRQNENVKAGSTIDFNNSDQWRIEFTGTSEYLPAAFDIAPGVTLPVGDYSYQAVDTAYKFGRQHALSGQLAASYGTFYDGHKAEVTLSTAQISFSPHFMTEPGITLDWVDLRQGRFNRTLFTERTSINVTPRMAIICLVQYNDSPRTVSSSARWRWEYTPGSDLFLVYSDGRDALSSARLRLTNRSVTLKATRLLRF